MGGRRITPAAEDITGQEKSQQAPGPVNVDWILNELNPEDISFS